MAGPLFPDLVQYGQPTPDWLKDSITKATAFLQQQAPATGIAQPAPVDAQPPPQPDFGVTGSPFTSNTQSQPDPIGLGPDSPQDPQSQVAKTKQQTKQREAPVQEAREIGYGDLGATLPDATKGVKNSRQAAARESQLADQAVLSAASAREAAQASEDAKADALVEASKVHVSELGAAQGDYAKARETAGKVAATKLAAAEADIQAAIATEPDQRRWWSNKSTLGKVGIIIGQIAHAMGSNPQSRSAVMATVEKLVDEDIEQQKQTIARKLADARDRKEDVRLSRAEEMANAKDDFGMRLTRLDAIDKQMAAAAQTMGKDQRRYANLMAARADLANVRSKAVSEYGNRLFQREEAGAARAHQMRMAKIEYGFKTRQAELAAQAKAREDLRIIPPELSNVRLVSRQPEVDKDGKPVLDKDGKPVLKPVTLESRALHKDYIEKAAKTATDANEEYILIKETLAELEKGTDIDLILGKNPRLNQVFQLLASRIATDPRVNKGSTTEPDYIRGTKIPMGQLADAGWLTTVTNLPARKAMAQAGLEYYLERQQTNVNNSLAQYPTPEGASLYWEPPKWEAPPDRELGNKYLTQQEREAEVANISAIGTGRDPLPRGTHLPPMTNDQVLAARTAEVESEGATAEGIVAEARKQLFKEADTPEEKKAAESALTRFVAANVERIDKVRDAQLKAATKIANEIYKAELDKRGTSRFGLDSAGSKALKEAFRDPSREDIRDKMELAGFSPGKLAKNDYDKVVAQVREIYMWKAEN